MSSLWSHIALLNFVRIREAVSHISHDLIEKGSRKRSKARKQELDWLARAVLDFGRMKYEFYKNSTTVVDVAELSLRFRETPRTITTTLKLLEQHKLAEQTEFPQLWKLHVADLVQQSGNGCVSSICGHNE
jgi:hypothetical protein